MRCVEDRVAIAVVLPRQLADDSGNGSVGRPVGPVCAEVGGGCGIPREGGRRHGAVDLQGGGGAGRPDPHVARGVDPHAFGAASIYGDGRVCSGPGNEVFKF